MIIITRPSPYGEELTHLCHSANLPAKHLPLFSIEKGRDADQLQSQLNKLKPNDIVIVTSPQVVHVIHTAKKKIQFPDGIQYIAIGSSSATLFKSLSEHPVSYPDHAENSEGLLTYLHRVQHCISGIQILILCGNNGRNIIKEKLESQGAVITNSYIYQRTPIHYPQSILREDDTKKIIVVTSAEHLLQLEFYCQEAEKTHHQLITSAVRIADEAARLGWQHIHLAQNANNQNLFKTISTLCHNAL